MESLRDLTARVGLEIDDHGLESLHHKIEGIHSSLELLAGAEILKGLFEMAERFSSVGEQIEGSAAAAGITAEAFQQLAFAASQSGVEQEQLSGALARLGRSLGEARIGSESAIESFGKIGISPEQLASFRNSTDALKAVSDRIAAIQDPVERTRLSMDLLGRGGSKLLKFLGKGAESMTEEMARAGDMGAIVSNEQIKRLADLEDNLSAFGQIIKSTFATIASYAAPIIIDLVQEIGKFWQVNRKGLELNLRKWFYDLGFMLGYTYEILTTVIQKVIDFAAHWGKTTSALAEVTLGLAGLSAAFWAGSKAISIFGVPLKTVTGLLKAAPLAFSLLSKATGLAAAAFLAIQTVTGTLLFNLGGLLLKIPVVGAALGGFFETLGLFIATSPLAPLLAGFAALLVLGDTLWTFWNGGGWEDTKLFRGLRAIVDLVKSAMGYLGIKMPSAPTAVSKDTSGWTGPPTAPLFPDQDTLNRNNVMNPLALNMGNQFAMGTNAQGVPNSLARPDAQITMANTYNITAPPGADPQKIAQMIKDYTAADRETMLRQAGVILTKPRVS